MRAKRARRAATKNGDTLNNLVPLTARHCDFIYVLLMTIFLYVVNVIVMQFYCKKLNHLIRFIKKLFILNFFDNKH